MKKKTDMEQILNGKEKKEQITQEDIIDLNTIFALARRAVANDEQQLIQIIQFRQSIVPKLESFCKEQEKGKVTKS